MFPFWARWGPSTWLAGRQGLAGELATETTSFDAHHRTRRNPWHCEQSSPERPASSGTTWPRTSSPGAGRSMASPASRRAASPAFDRSRPTCSNRRRSGPRSPASIPPMFSSRPGFAGRPRRRIIAANGALVRNLLAALEPSESLRHVALVTGLKHYLGPFEAYAKAQAGDPVPRGDAAASRRRTSTTRRRTSSSRRPGGRASPGACIGRTRSSVTPSATP